MDQPQVAPYGSWESPITSELIVAHTVRLMQMALDGVDTYWIELRPTEEGRNVIVRRPPAGASEDVTPSPFNARSRVHEYGGGAYLVAGDVVYFTNFTDQRLYRQLLHGEPEPMTPDAPLRFADMILDTPRDRIICVREDHRASEREAVASLVAIDLRRGGEGEVLVSGHDFYSSPRLSPDGARLAWLAWDHPNMPWDGTELWVAEVMQDSSLVNRQRVAGGPEESIFQPEWSPDGTLYFVSDRSGWWNIYRQRAGKNELVHERAAEFGQPQWVFGRSTYGFESAERIICTFLEAGRSYLAALDTATSELHTINIPYDVIEAVRVAPGRAVLRAGSPTEPTSIVEVRLPSGEIELLRRSSETRIDPTYLSVPEAVEFPTRDGRAAHAFYYAPQNPDYTGATGEKPPLIVMAHGGPTGAVSP
ncbi:MAG: S9 family peptidase, partial [Ardenticatenaceae bacterium]